MSNHKPWQNGSGCYDPTAYQAIRNIDLQNKPTDDAAHKVINIIKNILDVSGFELVERIQIRHKQSKRIYK